jgi:hypothetical protein
MSMNVGQGVALSRVGSEKREWKPIDSIYEKKKTTTQGLRLHLSKLKNVMDIFS